MELMIVLAVMGVLASITPHILTASGQVFILGKAKIELQEEARAAIYVITRELRQAQSNTVVIDRAGTQPYYSRLQFTKIQGVQVTVQQSGSSILLTEGTHVTTLSTNLAYMSFTFPRSDDMTILSVSFTLQKQIYGGIFKALHMASERVPVMN